MGGFFIIKRGDTVPMLPLQLKNPDGTLPNLNGASVLFKMSDPDSRLLVINRAATIADPVNALVNFPWQAGDTAVAKDYRAECEVTFVDGSVGTFPNKGYLTIHVEQDL